MKTNTNNNKVIAIDHTCLLEGKSNIKCNHWGCKVTAKTPQFYPGWNKFFADHGFDRFHVHYSIITAEEIKSLTDEVRANVPADILQTVGYLTGIKKGSDTANMNTGFTVEVRGNWPKRSVFSFDEVKFIHVEYQSLRSRSVSEIKSLIAAGNVDATNCLSVLNQPVMDVKEVAIYVGMKGDCDEN